VEIGLDEMRLYLGMSPVFALGDEGGGRERLAVLRPGRIWSVRISAGVVGVGLRGRSQGGVGRHAAEVGYFPLQFLVGSPG